MKRVKQKRSRKAPLIIVIAVLVIALGIGFYFWKIKKSPAESANIGISKSGTGGSINYNPPSEDEKNTSEQQKDDIINEETKDPSKPPIDSNLAVTISRANQLGKGEPLQVRTVVSGTSSGTCTLTLSKTGQTTITKTIQVTPDATYVTCNANIPASEFSADGEWNLEINVKHNNAVSLAASQKVSISK